MSESTLTLARPELLAEVGDYLGLGRDSTAWNTDNSNRVAHIIKQGALQFYMPPVMPNERRSHDWSFLHPTTTLSCIASYSTGTVTSSSTTVTLAGGTWPSWAATHGKLVVDGTRHTISSRDSDTQLTLSTAPDTAFAADTYELEHDNNYDAPDDFGGIEGSMTYDPDDDTTNIVQSVGEGKVRRFRQRDITEGYPRYYAVRPDTDFTGASGQRWQIMLWPSADSTYTLTYKYYVLADALTAALPYAYGGMVHSHTLLASCMAAAELVLNDTRGARWDYFFERLKTSIEHDRRATRAENFGYNGDSSSDAMARLLKERDSTYVTYDGTYGD